MTVPGAGSSVASGWPAGGHNDAINVDDQSLAGYPGDDLSVIAWMGYETPDGFDDPRVVSPLLAREGGFQLAQDVNGLWVTHDGSPRHVTVLGHSYGSTTVADAFAASGAHANDAILLGSPGTDLAHNAADFHLDGGNVYVGSASSDPVSRLGESGSVPNGLNEALGHPFGRYAELGTDPAGDGFGSIRFHAEVPGHDGLSLSDHSHYYDLGGAALRGIAHIVTGHGSALAQVVQAAREMVRAAALAEVTGEFLFESCNDQGPPPYRGRVNMSFAVPGVSRPRSISAGSPRRWFDRGGRRAGRRVARGSAQVCGECRNIIDHRNDGKTVGVEVSDQLSGIS